MVLFVRLYYPGERGEKTLSSTQIDHFDILTIRSASHEDHLHGQRRPRHRLRLAEYVLILVPCFF